VRIVRARAGTASRRAPSRARARAATAYTARFPRLRANTHTHMQYSHSSHTVLTQYYKAARKHTHTQALTKRNRPHRTGGHRRNKTTRRNNTKQNNPNAQTTRPKGKPTAAAARWHTLRQSLRVRRALEGYSTESAEATAWATLTGAALAGVVAHLQRCPLQPNPRLQRCTLQPK
jgi:hypothetical protein